jgi:hypothetical protein
MSRLNNDISFEQFSVLRSAAEAEAQLILKARNAAKRAANEAKRQAEAEAKAMLDIERAKAEAKKAEAAKAKAEAKARKAEAENAKAEAKKNEAQLKRQQMENEEKAQKSKKPKDLGCIVLIILVIAFLLIFSPIKSCHKEQETEKIHSSYVTEEGTDNDDGSSIGDNDLSSTDNSSIEEKLEKQFDYVSEYDHYFEIKKGGKYGIADLKGNIIIQPKYDYISPVSEDSKTIEVLANNKYGLLSSLDLTEILEPSYDYIGFYNEETGLIEVCKNGKYGLYCPKKKKEVAPCIYHSISYDDGLYHVSKDSKSGYLNSDGSLLKPLQ